jgi:hypothetical protein
MPAIDNLLRRIVNNRRRSPRKHMVYDALVRNEHNQILFRGKTVNISRTGARLIGLPVDTGTFEGQQVLIEILVPPKNVVGNVKHMALAARIIHVDETDDSYSLGIRFERELSH